jgi:hypothetical protein
MSELRSRECDCGCGVNSNLNNAVLLIKKFDDIRKKKDIEYQHEHLEDMHYLGVTIMEILENELNVIREKADEQRYKLE